MIRRLAQVACKIEQIEGSPETLANSDAGITVYDPKFDVNVNSYKRDPARASMSNLARIQGGANVCKLTFKADLRTSGSVAVAPDIGILLKACGFTEAVVAQTSVTYTPASLAIPSYTMALYMDGTVKKMTGARGTVKFVHKLGEPVQCEFEFTGILVAVTDLGLLTTVSYSSETPPKFQGTAILTMGSYSAILTALTIDIANKIAVRENANKASGAISAYIVSREPKGSYDPEFALVGTHDFYGKMIAGTPMAFSEVLGSGAGHIITVTMPVVQYTEISDADRNGIAVAQAGFAVSGSAGDDELSIAMT